MKCDTWTTPTRDQAVLETIVRSARIVLSQALPADLRDDRFSDAWADSLAGAELRVAVVRDDTDEPICFLGGVEEEGSEGGPVVQLDALASTHISNPEEVLRFAADQLAPRLASSDRVELWAKPAFDFHQQVAGHLGLEPLRALHQMRCSLPVANEPIESRPFVPGVDEMALLRVNNRAFASHPDQGNMTVADLAAASSEPWFDADGIRLHEVDGEVAGFCWTKIHDEPRLGEIYAIGIDPDHHGKGLGVPMTTAGLDWLSNQGLTVGMLYVEADNEPALRTYDRLGFTVVRTDRAWFR